MNQLAKKIIPAAMAAGLLFTSCGTEPSLEGKLNPEKPIPIEVWHYYNGAQKKAFDDLVTQFNETVGAEKGIMVEGFSHGNVDELTERLIDSANKKVGAKEIPNIFTGYADTAYQIDQLGLVAGLDNYITKEELSEYIDSYVEEGYFGQEDSFKIFPTAKSTEILMLNKTAWDDFAAATGTKTDELKTFEGIASVGEKYYNWTDSLTEAPDDGKAFFGRDALANYFVIGCKQLGCEIFEVKEGKVTLNLDEAVLRRLWDNYYVPYINGYFVNIGKFSSDDAKTGDIIALVGSTSGATYFPTQVTVNDNETYPIEAEAFDPPYFEGGEKYAVQQGAGMVVTKSDEVTEYASTVFLKWFTDTERNIEFSLMSAYMPVKKEANKLEEIEKVLEAKPDIITETARLPLTVSINTTNNFKMYTNKAFENGTKARSVLSYSLQDKVKEDRQKVLDLIAQGTPREEAVAQFNTDENFQSWFISFSEQLDQTVAQ